MKKNPTSCQSYDRGEDMKRFKKFILPVVILGSMFIGSLVIPWAWAAISNISGIAVQGSSIQWNNVKDASQGDDLTNGLPASALYGYDGTNWDRLLGTAANGLDVDVTRVQGTVTTTSTGTKTPADAYTNPTTAVDSWALGGVFNGTTWDRRRSATGDALAATGLASIGLMGYNGATWDRLRSDTTNGLDVDVTRVGGTVTKTPAGTGFYSIKHTNVTNAASINLAFGFTSKTVQIETASGNTLPVIVDWIGGTAVAPAADTAGDDVVEAGRIVTLDDYAVTSISVIATTAAAQTISVRAWQ